MSNQVRRYLIGSATVLIGWYLCVLFLWALQPLEDSVPVGIDPATATWVSTTVSCNTMFDSSARGTDPLPTVEEPLAFTRTACEGVQSDARIVFALDTLALVLLLALLVVIAVRSRDLDLEPSPSQTKRAMA